MSDIALALVGASLFSRPIYRTLRRIRAVRREIAEIRAETEAAELRAAKARARTAELQSKDREGGDR